MTARRYEQVGLKPEAVHHSPREMQDAPEAERRHMLELAVDGRRVGHAELVYMAKPIPSYYINFVYVREPFQGFGFGAAIMDNVNRFLKKKGRMGILYNSIDEDSPARGMYAKHGWHESEKFSEWMTYNEPKRAAKETIEQSIVRASDWMGKAEGGLEEEAAEAA